MKNLLIILSLLLLVASCKKSEEPTCEGPDCPLSDGTYCSGNFENINDQCVCPPENVQVNDSLCIPREDDLGLVKFYTTFDCECATGDIIMGFDTVNQFAGIYSLNEEYEPTQQNRIGGPFNFLPGSSYTDFNALLYPIKCQGSDLYMHGSISGNTVTYELFFINTTTLDTCGPFQTTAL